MTDTIATRPPVPVTAFIAASLFFTGVTYASTLPYGGIAAIDGLGMSNATYAWVLMAGSIIGATASVVLGFVSDKLHDRRRLIIITALLGALGNAVIYLFRDPIAYIVAYCVILPFGGALFSQTFSFARVYYNRTQPDRAEFRITMLRTVFTIAWVVIPPVAGWIAAAYTVFDVYAFAAVAYALCALCFALLLGTRTAAIAPDAKPAAKGTERWIETPMLIGIVGVILISCAARLNGTAGPLAIISNFGGTLTDVGIYSGLAALLEVPFMVMWGYLGRRFTKATLIMVATLIYAVYLFLVGQVHTVAEVLWLQIFNAIATAALMSVPISYMQEAIKGRVGLSTSLLDVVFVISGLLGAGLFALTTSTGQYLMAFGVAALLCLAGIVVMFVAHGIVGRRAAG